MANNSLSCGPLTIKYLVFICNLVFFICGVAIVIVGSASYSFFCKNMTLFEDYRNPATGVIVLGSAVMIFSFFGCCGSKRESVWMLRIFAFFLAFLLICEIIGGIAIAVMKGDIGDIIVKQMNETMPKYGGNNDTILTESWDNLQHSLKCCGTTNYTNWNSTKWSQTHDGSVPDSCCIKETKNCGLGIFNDTNPTNIYSDGCASSLKSAFIENLGSIVSVTVAVAIVEVIGLLMACSLIKALKDKYEIL